MATTVSTGGGNYSIPAYGDSGWAQGAGNLSSYLIALATNKLDISGGAFTLTADANFGATFGFVAAYLKSETALIATTGVLRLAKTDAINWRNNANGANLPLAINGSDQLTYNGSIVVTSSVGPTPVQKIETYIAGTALNNYTGSLTVINMVGSYVANGKNIFVYVNGLLESVTLDYTETSTTAITFGSNLNTGDRIVLRWDTF
jgi:hypothetical protein